MSPAKGRPYGPGTLQVWDDPDRSRGLIVRVLPLLLFLVVVAALVAALASRVVS